ncbi:MAG: hypothetical protein FD169_2258 [Bacillota bacterium]|nr:MAG: hypothetical protein FD169_2258 [Bacillota bacterium]
MKRALAALLLCALVVSGIAIVRMTGVERVHFVFNPQGSTVYSPFNAVVDRIRIGVERVAVHRYFTIYSYVTGDESHMELLLMLEHLDKLALQIGQPEIRVKDNLGNLLTPFPYYEVLGYPTDDPLGYKLTLWARFPPPEKEVSHIDIYCKYLGKSFEINSVPIR